MGNIVLLDELTINQIAAGEVIERPANVVKELVENSIDAGANNISIEIKNGGISYIRVTDNGKGIKKDDMQIAFERHATSKIRSTDDLLKIMTMGFRGEALASIAAIANVELISCSSEEVVGNKILVEGGNILSCEEYGCPKGTSITVKNLFYNTPVRYKFLKKDFTEAGYIEEIISKIALVNSNISFKLVNSGKIVLSTSGNSDMLTVIHNIYGNDVVKSILPIDYVYENMKVTGIVGKPEIARSNRSNQIIYINKRNIKNKTISSAIDEAYKTLIPNGKFGFAILNIDINPELVDVNVHPSKIEVRFQNENDVFKAIYHAVKNVLLGSDLSRIIECSKEKQEEIKKNVIDNTRKELFNIPKAINDFKEKIQNMENRNEQYESMHLNKNKVEEDYKKEIASTMYDTQDIGNNEKNKVNEEKIVNIYEESKQEDVEKNISLFQNRGEEIKEIKYKYVGTVFETYIIIEYMGEMYIIDQHAMHERVLYEQVKKSYYEKTLSQVILIPEVITLAGREVDIVKENMDMFNKVGFVIEEFGDNTFKITSVPFVCINIGVKDIFLDILDELQGINKTYKEEREEKFISTIACKAAVKANMQLKIEEIDALIKDALKLENPFSCPHGRPTAIKMSKYEIERKFERK